MLKTGELWRVAQRSGAKDLGNVKIAVILTHMPRLSLDRIHSRRRPETSSPVLPKLSELVSIAPF
jgi:hypothetical protein